MRPSEVFLSVVVVADDAESWLEERLLKLSEVLNKHFDYYDIVVVDNGSRDGTGRVLEDLQGRVKNIQGYTLVRRQSPTAALTAGLDHAIGDFTAMLDLACDPPERLPEMVEMAVAGYEIIYALPAERVRSRGVYERLSGAFLRFLARINDVDLPRAMTTYRLLSRSVLNFMLDSANRHRTVLIAPALSGYRYATLEYERVRERATDGRIGRESLYRALDMLFSSSARPLRLVTLFSLGICGITVLYSVYVVVIVLFKEDVASGWASLSLQVSGLFFLVCVVLAVMSEYLMQVLEATTRRPIYHVARESHSSTMEYQQDLNVVEIRSDSSGRH